MDRRSNCAAVHGVTVGHIATELGCPAFRLCPPRARFRSGRRTLPRAHSRQPCARGCCSLARCPEALSGGAFHCPLSAVPGGLWPQRHSGPWLLPVTPEPGCCPSRPQSPQAALGRCPVSAVAAGRGLRQSCFSPSMLVPWREPAVCRVPGALVLLQPAGYHCQASDGYSHA